MAQRTAGRRARIAPLQGGTISIGSARTAAPTQHRGEPPRSAGRAVSGQPRAHDARREPDRTAGAQVGTNPHRPIRVSPITRSDEDAQP